MRFIDRLSLLVKADAHGVLEQLEEKTLLAKQHLREAELELVRKRARCETLEEETRRMGEELQRLEDEIRSLDEDVELALSGGNDELARFAVRRLLPKRSSAQTLRRRIEEGREEQTRLGEKLALQERAFEEMQRRVRARLAAAREQEERGELGLPEPMAADEEVELELLRRRGAAGAAS